MSGTLFILAKLFLTFGLLLGFGFWQLWSLRRERSAGTPGHAEGQEGADPGAAKPGER